MAAELLSLSIDVTAESPCCGRGMWRPEIQKAHAGSGRRKVGFAPLTVARTFSILRPLWWANEGGRRCQDEKRHPRSLGEQRHPTEPLRSLDHRFDWICHRGSHTVKSPLVSDKADAFAVSFSKRRRTRRALDLRLTCCRAGGRNTLSWSFTRPIKQSSSETSIGFLRSSGWIMASRESLLFGLPVTPHLVSTNGGSSTEPTSRGPPTFER